MSITSRFLADDEPRERLLRQGPAALSYAELIGLVTGIDGQGRDDLSMAHELIVEIGGLRRLARYFPYWSRAPARGLRVGDAGSYCADQPCRGLHRRDSRTRRPALARERWEKVLVLVANAANRVPRVVPVAVV